MADLLEPEFAPAFQDWKASPTPTTSGRLLRTIDPVLKSALKTYSPTGGPLLHSKARRLALGAMEQYDPNRGKLRTHLMTHLQGLRRMGAKQDSILSVPEQVKLDQGHLLREENALRDRLGREPSTQEVADATGLSKKRIGYVRGGAPSGVAEGQLRSLSDGGDELYQPPVVFQDDDSGWHEFVYHGLQPTDQLILEYTVGLHGRPQLSNQDLAKKLGITPPAVSQRKKRIEQMLDQRNELAML